MHTHAPLPQYVGLLGALLVGDPVLYAGVKERVAVFFQLHKKKERNVTKGNDLSSLRFVFKSNVRNWPRSRDV